MLLPEIAEWHDSAPQIQLSMRGKLIALAIVATVGLVCYLCFHHAEAGQPGSHIPGWSAAVLRTPLKAPVRNPFHRAPHQAFCDTRRFCITTTTLLILFGAILTMAVLR